MSFSKLSKASDHTISLQDIKVTESCEFEVGKCYPACDHILYPSRRREAIARTSRHLRRGNAHLLSGPHRYIVYANHVPRPCLFKGRLKPTSVVKCCFFSNLSACHRTIASTPFCQLQTQTLSSGCTRRYRWQHPTRSDLLAQQSDARNDAHVSPPSFM